MLVAPPRLSIIIPASNEADWIRPCLAAIFASKPVPGGAEVIVVANGCHDATADVARQMVPPPDWALQVIETAQGSKPLALNLGDQVALGQIRAYLDADCTVSPGLFAALTAAFGTKSGPAYGTATPQIPRPKSWISRQYSRFWLRLPFNQSAATGYGLYAVNAAGRARWAEFPALISDDSFVRLQFDPAERFQIAASYDWPMIEGFAALVRVRARQNRGMAELQAFDPALLAREAKPPLAGKDLAKLALRDPLGFLTYAAVIWQVRRAKQGAGFTRGR